MLLKHTGGNINHPIALAAATCDVTVSTDAAWELIAHRTLGGSPAVLNNIPCSSSSSSRTGAEARTD